MSSLYIDVYLIWWWLNLIVPFSIIFKWHKPEFQICGTSSCSLCIVKKKKKCWSWKQNGNKTIKDSKLSLTLVSIWLKFLNQQCTLNCWVFFSSNIAGTDRVPPTQVPTPLSTAAYISSTSNCQPLHFFSRRLSVYLSLLCYLYSRPAMPRK